MMRTEIAVICKAGEFMRNANWIGVLLVGAYCIPFAFLSVYGDAVFGTMLLYAMMMIGFALLCAGALKIKRLWIVYIGNILSGGSSYVAAKISGLEPMGDYFKPFTAYSLIIVISIFAFIAQMVLVRVYRAKKKRVDDK